MRKQLKKNEEVLRKLEKIPEKEQKSDMNERVTHATRDDDTRDDDTRDDDTRDDDTRDDDDAYDDDDTHDNNISSTHTTTTHTRKVKIIPKEPPRKRKRKTKEKEIENKNWFIHGILHGFSKNEEKVSEKLKVNEAKKKKDTG